MVLLLMEPQNPSMYCWHFGSCATSVIENQTRWYRAKTRVNDVRRVGYGRHRILKKRCSTNINSAMGSRRKRQDLTNQPSRSITANKRHIGRCHVLLPVTPMGGGSRLVVSPQKRNYAMKLKRWFGKPRAEQENSRPQLNKNVSWWQSL